MFSTTAIFQVTVHPLVLLSVVDHFSRVSKSQSVKRVVGVLLGSIKKDKTLDIGNSFAGGEIQIIFFRFLAEIFKKLFSPFR